MAKAKSAEVNVRGFDVGYPPVIVDHSFRCGADGQLEHYTDGRLRSQVPPEGFADYVERYPECAPVLAALKGRGAAPAAVVFSGAAATAKKAELEAGAKKKKAGKGKGK